MLKEKLLRVARQFGVGPRYVLLRKQARRAVARVRLRGDEVYCPCCGRSATTFLSHDICAFCDSRPRQRFMWLYLSKTLQPGDSVLHFAPEEALQKPLRRVPGVTYTSADLKSPFAEILVDLDDAVDVRAKLGKGSYSVIVISHVLEHVRDDVAVLGRLTRVGRAGGRVLVQVPEEADRAETYEDWSITSPEGRLRAFGQEDHVRVYGSDVVRRFERAGVRVRPVDWEQICSPEDCARMRLHRDTIYMCGFGDREETVF
jgi:hypothetical protein